MVQVKTEVIDPGLAFPAFPAFPDPIGGDGKVIPVLDGETVKLPLWYWIRITEYVVEVQKVQEIYEGWKGVYLPPENE
ncbi:MAG: hypothetical protein LBK62_13380 [Treponema sp.]|jgi:hypothetical protein|nr:hypothetical protein [Treponema sp.]